jgi:phenylalanyl-tRNA synthetase beta chain
MKLSANWIRDYVDLAVDDRRLAEDLTDVGLGVEGFSGAGNDLTFEMEIGTNRPDAMNHYGVAREAAAIYDLPLKPLAPSLPSAAKAASGAASDGAARSRPLSKQDRDAAPSASSGQALKGRSSTALDATVASSGSAANATFPIIVEEPQLCPRFSARVIRNTRIGPSPQQIAHRLQLLDQRPISNAVDATNYVLWEIGKPTHVFDMDLLEGGKIIVRHARKGETLKTLDGVERKLTTEDLVVCDAKKPVGLAGVMGGYDTMITEKTRNILIESAWWDPGMVRKMSRRHGLHTDASHRFERGADFESTILSCDLVAQMILESGGGELVGDVVDVVSRKMDQAPIVLRLSEVHRILGPSLDAGQVFRLLKRLGFTLIPEGQGDAQFRVHIPSWRLDVEREIDLIEEIARLHGYDKFENTLPAYSGAVVELPHTHVDAALRMRSLALGYNEAISLTFISHADAEKFESAPSAANAARGTRPGSARLEAAPFQSTTAHAPAVEKSTTGPASAADRGTARVLELENPLSEEASVMRTSLVPGMLDMLAWNLNRDVADVRLFEMGAVFELVNGDRVEPRRLCLGATATAVRGSMPAKGALDVSKGEYAAAAEAFRAFKGDVENLLATCAGDASYDRETAEYFHLGRSARALVNGAPVAQFGQIHPDVAAARKLRQDVFVAEFDLEQLYKLGLRPVKFTPLGKYPAVERDFSLVFDDAVSFERMQAAVLSERPLELRDFAPVEVFRGGLIAAGKYSVLLRVKFQSAERTLREDEVAQWSAKIVAALTQLGGAQRS